MAPYVAPLIVLGSLPKTKTELPLPLKILTSTTTTAVLGGILGALLLAPAAVVGVAAKVATKAAPSIIKAATPLAAIAILAPKTTKKVLSTEGGIETAIATAISPVAGIVVGLEKGTGLVKAAIEENAPALKTAAVIAGSAAAVAGAAAVGVVVAKALKKIPEVPTTLKDIPKEVAGAASVTEMTPATEIKPLPTTPQTSVITPATTTITPTTTKRRTYRRAKPKTPTTIRQSVNVVLQNKNTGLTISNKRYLNARVLN